MAVGGEHVVLDAGSLAPGRHERSELGPGLRRCDTSLYSADQIELMVPTVLSIGRVELQGQPQLDMVVHDVESGRHDADHFALDTIHLDRVPQNVRPAGE